MTILLGSGSSPRIFGPDHTRARTVSLTEKITRATLAVTMQSQKGFFVGFGASWNPPTKARDPRFTNEDQLGDYYDWQIRIGYHPGVQVSVRRPTIG